MTPAAYHIKGYRFLSIALTLCVLNLFIYPLVTQFSHVLATNLSTDSAMRLVHVFDLYQGQSWWQHFSPRIFPPTGAFTHYWTRPQDILLLAALWPLTFWMSAKMALLIAASILPLLFLIFMVITLWRITNTLALHPLARFFVVMAFLLNPWSTTRVFAPFQVDYNMLSDFLVLLYVGSLLKILMLKNSHNHLRLLVQASVIAMLALWTSISTLLPLAVSYSFFYWRWLLNADTIPKQQDGTLLILHPFLISVLSLPVLYIEHGDILVVHHDILSIVHTTFFMLLAFAFFMVVRFSTYRHKAIKLLVTLGCACVVFLIMNTFFPHFYLGPYALVDPYFFTHYFKYSAEFQSPWYYGAGIYISMLVLYFMALIAIVMCYKQLTANPYFYFFLYVTTFLACLSSTMARWVDVAIPLFALQLGLYVSLLLTSNTNTFHLRLKQPLIFVVSVTLALCPMLFTLYSKKYNFNPDFQCSTELNRAIYKEQIPLLQKPINLYVNSTLASNILLLTNANVYATNDHYNLAGRKLQVTLTAASPQEAYPLIKQYQIQAILLCKASLYPKGSVLEQLQQGKLFPWAKTYALPSNTPSLQLFQITDHKL